MNAIFATASITFLSLRRDRIFIPAAIVGLLFSGLANLVSDLSLEAFTKILFDIGTFGFHVTGAVVAIFWGTKCIQESRIDGSLETQLSGALSRSQWMIGTYLGLAAALGFLALLLIAIWQGFMIVGGFGVMTFMQLLTFLFLGLLWLILAAVAMMFSGFSSHGVALFASFATWLIGLSSRAIADSLPPATSALTKRAIEAISWVLDFQRFQLVDMSLGSQTPLSQQALSFHAGYGLCLILMAITLGCIFLAKRDIKGC